MKKNHDKALLAGALVVAAGIAYLGYAKTTSVEEEFVFSSSGSGKNDTSVAGAAVLKETLATVTTPLQLEQAEVGDSKRPVDLFVGVALFAKKPAGGGTAVPVDLIKGEMVHPPIPNSWWLDNGIDPGFADSPARDADNDGFSNQEEFEAKTNPADAKSFPGLITKLAFVKDESIGFFLWFSSALGPEKYQFKITALPPVFESANPAQQEAFLSRSDLVYVRTKDYIGSSSNIFTEGFAKDRFLLKSVVSKEVTNARTNLTTTNEFATIEDLSENKKGTTFEIPKTPNSAARPGTVRYDRTAVLNLNAVGESGKDFKVKENTSFSLPDGKPEKNYLLKSITRDSITVEYKDASGATQTIEIKKKS
jgi:hypothetical protein